jgi:hypothetical protein
MSAYDADYYERGTESGKSNYQNYRWIPELTIPMAMSIIDFLKIKPKQAILDYGCAKGYLVKALRMLHRDAWGYDVSRYAISNADKDTQPYLIKIDDIFSRHFKYGIFKDVLEHIPVQELRGFLPVVNIKKILTVVPLGRNGKYIAAANNMDITHIICEPKEWWLKLFSDCGWDCVYSSTKLEGIKDAYTDDSHLFMVHTR